MKNIFYILLLLPTIIFAQYPSNSGHKITLGEQTTADGLIFRGVAATDTVRKPSIDTMAYMVLDTTTNIIWHYKKATSNAWLRLNLLPSDTASMLTNYWRAGRFSGILPVANGGTGTSVRIFVDTINTQTVNGAKTFSSTITGARFDPTSSSVSGTGMYLESANNLTFSAGGVKKLKLPNTGNNVLTGPLEAGGFFINNVGGAARLQVNGNNSEAIAYFYNNSNSTGNVPGVAIEAGTNSSDYSLSVANSTGASYLRVRGDGNVGIRTANPLSVLNVQGSGYFPAKLITLTGAEPTRYSANIGTNIINGNSIGLSFGTRSDNINYDNTLNLHNGNVGIGTTSPLTKLDVIGLVKADIFQSTTQNTFYLNYAGNNDFTLTASGNFRILNNNQSVGLFSITNTGAATFSSLGTGTVYSSSGTLTNTNPSDKRLKNNITDISWGLSDILKLRPVSFNWKDDKISQGKQFGFIAQEVREVMPEAIKIFGEDVKYLGLEKDAIYATLVKAVQELSAQVDILKQEIINLKNK